MHNGKVLFQTEGCEVVDCIECGYAHVNPLPSQEELSQYYEKKFYQNSKTSYFKDYEDDKDWWEINYLEILKYYNVLGPQNGTRRLLDIGSGPGLFLDVAEKNNFDACGIEPSEKAYEYSTNKFGCKVLNVTIEELNASEHQYEFINSYLVLEHIAQPLEFIQKAKSMLVDGGLLSIVVPNDFNPIQEINVELGKKEWWVSPFEHLNYFKKESLAGLFRKAGLEIVLETVTFPIDLFLLMGRDYLADGDEGKKCHQMRKTLEFNLQKTNSNQFKDCLYKSFSDLGIGRELIIIGKKTV